jgi:hypothetical protein
MLLVMNLALDLSFETESLAKSGSFVGRVLQGTIKRGFLGV